MSSESRRFISIYHTEIPTDDLQSSTGEASRSSSAKVHSNTILVFSSLPVSVVFLATLLTTFFIGLILALMVGVHLGNALLHPDPFNTYESIWPGQPVENVVAYAHQTTGGTTTCYAPGAHNENYPELNVKISGLEATAFNRDVLCSSYPKDGVFSMMSLTIDHNRVEGLNLVSSVLPEDALLLYWGIPDVVKEAGNRLLFLQWQRGTYLATAMIRSGDSVAENLLIATRANGD